MLKAIVLELKPVDDAFLPVSHGLFAYATALDLIWRLDPHLSKRIHDPDPNKPLTVSPIWEAPQAENALRLCCDRTYKWRLTELNEEVLGTSEITSSSLEITNRSF